MRNPILITGADRSGSSIIAKTFSMCGAYGGFLNTMHENVDVKRLHNFYIENKSDGCHMLDLSKVNFKDKWRGIVENYFIGNGLRDSDIPFYKDSAICQTWQLWGNAFPEAKWIIVRRRTGDIIQSCKQTAYMLRFKKESNRRMIEVSTEEQGWLWWVREYEKRFMQIIEAYPNNYKIVWPERMVMNDFEQMKEVVEWSGLQWNPEIEVVIPKLLRKPE